MRSPAEQRRPAPGELTSMSSSVPVLRGFGFPKIGPEMDWGGPRRDLERLVGDAQRRWGEIQTNLGICIEEGKGRFSRHISSFKILNPGFESARPDGERRGAGPSWLGGFLSWRRDFQRFGEENRAEFLRPWTQNHGHRRRSSNALFASLSGAGDVPSQRDPEPLFQLAMGTDQVARRLTGVPVYTVSNSANEFILISDYNSQKSLGIFCFRKEDAESLRSQVCDREPSLGKGARVVAVSLEKVYQLNTEGIAFRFLPDPQQVKNALDARIRSEDKWKAFDGVPVFQSDSLILRSKQRRLCPVFFCKEDLERALSRAFQQQQRANPALRVTSDIQVGSFEDVLKRMERNEEDTGWGDIVFIPPGMDAMSHMGKALSKGAGKDTVVG